ncbi:uncharacterized protein [Ptychodera flava]|uniref:uncharacterized protein isoform X2 n=1 Tax=Ptychodera flava TaxID=63121 RepID=UPI00396A92FC
MDLIGNKESYGLHSPATLRKSNYGHSGTYSPITKRKNPPESGLRARSNTIDIPPSQKSSTSNSPCQSPSTPSPTRGLAFFNLFKKSRKKGASKHDEFSDSPSGSPEIHRRQRTSSNESSDVEVDSPCLSPTKKPDRSHSSSEEEKELAKGDITLFEVPQIICEPPPENLISILKHVCSTSPCCDIVGNSQPDEGDDSRSTTGDSDRQSDCTCTDTEKNKEQVSEEAGPVESEKCGDGEKGQGEKSDHSSNDGSDDEPDKVEGSVSRECGRKCVSWDPSVKDPKPRKDSYTSYIECWHKEFLRQQRQRKLKFQEMQRRHYTRQSYQSSNYASYMTAGVAYF